MKKIILYILFFIFISLFSFFYYFSFVGIQTKSFNKKIKDSINKFDENLGIQLDYVQLYLNIKDLTGAGDLFAAGFLHGYINELSVKECLEKGTELSSKVIQQIGARL